MISLLLRLLLRESEDPGVAATRSNAGFSAGGSRNCFDRTRDSEIGEAVEPGVGVPLVGDGVDLCVFFEVICVVELPKKECRFVCFIPVNVQNVCKKKKKTKIKKIAFQVSKIQKLLYMD